MDENFEGEPTEKGVSLKNVRLLQLLPFFPFSGVTCSDVCVSRDGPMPSISLPPILKTRSGTPVSVAGDGSATGSTKQWTPGLRWVLLHNICM